MKMRAVAPMRIAKIGYIIMSVVFCIVGILFIAFNSASSVVIGWALGITMIVFGIIKIVGYFSRDLFRLAFQYDLGFGILLVFLGIIVLAKTTEVMSFIFIAMGIAILADALFKIQIAIDSKRFGIRSWWSIFAMAIVTAVIGLVLVFRPVESIHILTVILGISLLAEGILNLCVALTTVKIVKHQQPDVIEVSIHDNNE